MAFTGPAPKQYRRNRNPLAHDWTEVLDVPFTAAPKLPPQRDNGQPWPQAALRQWRMWSRMPICSLWDESDWGFAMRALEVLVQWQEAGTAALASEVRLMERTMGVTRMPGDRCGSATSTRRPRSGTAARPTVWISTGTCDRGAAPRARSWGRSTRPMCASGDPGVGITGQG